MRVTVQTSGFRELDQALEQLATPAARKASARRAMRKAAEPIVHAAQGFAPRGATNTLAPSVSVGTQLSKRQRGLHRKMFQDDRSAVEMFIGAGPLNSAHTQEFGTIHHGPQPFMRPAWEQGQNKFLTDLGAELWADISKAVARAERRAARLAERGA